jgi:hypothetical protein
MSSCFVWRESDYLPTAGRKLSEVIPKSLFPTGSSLIEFLRRLTYLSVAMKRDNPIRTSVFDCLVFPAPGGIPISAFATAGFAFWPSPHAPKWRRK